MVERVSPALVRRVVALALGAALGSGAATAGAAPRLPDAGWAAVAPAVAGATATPATTARAVPDPAWRAVVHDRPAAVPGSAARPATSAPEAQERVVHRGDSLWSIAAARLGPGASAGDVLREQHRLYALNAHVVGADPDLLQPGQVLRLT
nr:LysM domain-containing protein [Kineococcus siccus]